MRLPDYIQLAMDRINAHGEQVFVVGGACRDVMLGLTPHDYDLATSATPSQLKGIFSDFKLVLMGEAFGTVGVIIDSHLVELTTFRVEGGYLDHRHPTDLTFTKYLEDDLARRDFTINAMAFHPETGWIDYHHGQEDLNTGIIRLVGDAEQRMKEDALRALRALRFASRFGFRMEPLTEQAVRRHLPASLLLPAERVLNEWKIILVGPYATDILTQYYQELTGLIPPHTTIIHLQRLSSLANDYALRMTAIISPNDVVTWWNRWRGDKKSLKTVLALHHACGLPHPITRQDIHRWLTKVPLEYREIALPLWLGEYASNVNLIRWHEDLLMTHAPLSVRDLAINGHDLHRLEVPHTLRAGLLEILLDEIIGEQLLNRHADLIHHVPLLVAKLSDKKIK